MKIKSFAWNILDIVNSTDDPPFIDKLYDIIEIFYKCLNIKERRRFIHHLTMISGTYDKDIQAFSLGLCMDLIHL